MKKKLLVSVIAIVLVAAIVGSCFALYSVNATSKNIDITAGYQVVNLEIRNGANSAAQETITLSGFSPEDASTRTKTVDLTLRITNAGLADGVHGVFAASLTGELASYITTTVNTLSTAEGSVSGDITSAATGAGYDVALSSTPVYVRLTFTLTDAAIADFSLAANKSASLTLSWTVASGSVFTYDANAYYLVGTVNGVTAWYPCATSIVLDDTPSSGNQAMKEGITLSEGDEFKIVKNYEAGDGSWQWFGAPGSGANLTIAADGTYNVYVNSAGEVYVASAS